MALEDVIKQARVKKNLKQDEAAKQIGVTVQTYSKWENGKTEPKASQVGKLAELLGLSEREICQGNLNERLELEEFLDRSNASRKGGNNSTMEAVMLWKFLVDHETYFKKLDEVYKDEPNHYAKFMNKASS